MSLLAITGATGFVGGALLDRALGAGHRVRALARRPQPPRDGVEWVAGSLEDAPALAALVAGADAVVHVAGVVGARDRESFARGNVDGTRAIVAAARAGSVRRFVHVSSLAAREPALSDYCWSKAEAERVVAASGLDWTMVRPPAVYGPGDSEMRDIFRLAARGFALLPVRGRLSLIEVGDLARLLLALATGGEGIGAIYEPDDGRPGGWSHASFARAVGQAAGRDRVRTVSAPHWMLRAGAWLDTLVRRDRAKLTPDRAAYLAHGDWVVTPGRQPPPDLWRAQVPTLAGLRRTAQWYRAQRIL